LSILIDYDIIRYVKSPITLAALFIIALASLLTVIVKRRSNKRTTWLFILFLVSCVAIVLIAIWAPSPPLSPGRLEDRVVDLHFTKETDLKEILAECARQLDVALAFDQSLAGKKLSLSSKAMLSSVMDQICAVEGCRWEVAEGHPRALLVRMRASVPPGTSS
jgi:hypothetical protein